MPALVIGAGHESVHPFSYAEWLHGRLPNSQLHKVPAKDHDAEHRDAIADAIASFLSSVYDEAPVTPRDAVVST